MNDKIQKIIGLLAGVCWVVMLVSGSLLIDPGGVVDARVVTAAVVSTITFLVLVIAGIITEEPDPPSH